MQHSANVVILDDSRQQVLLQKREDFRLWNLPGGMVEVGEAPAEAAVREAKEETGLDVEVIRHIADFNCPQIDEIVHVYDCRVIGGEIVKQGSETLDVAWFALDQLPKRLVRTSHAYLEAALAQHDAVLCKTMTFPRYYVALRAIALGLRNLRNRFLR